MPSNLRLELAPNENPRILAFVDETAPRTIKIAKNLRPWAEEEMEFEPKLFAERVAAIVSHETLHSTVAKVADFDASVALDNYFGKVGAEDLCQHGLFNLDKVFADHFAFYPREWF